MSTATLSAEGQLVIPSSILEAMQLQAGDRLELKVEGGRLIVQRVEPERAKLIQGKFGRLVLTAPPDAPPMSTEVVKALLEDFP